MAMFAKDQGCKRRDGAMEHAKVIRTMTELSLMKYKFSLLKIFCV